jgi:hypothetical protein
LLLLGTCCVLVNPALDLKIKKDVMLTGIEYRNPIGPDLRRTSLEPYWAQYFDYEASAPNLHAVTEAELQREVEQARGMEQPYLDSQQAISRILTALGPRHSFHRQFNERFPDYRPHQVLGMQLYAMMARDETLWVYTQTQHRGHMFPHSVYFIPVQDAQYRSLAQRSGI